MVGMLATSKAGHDKAEVYVIVAEDEKYVYLCDGRLRPLEKPKKKSRKHIQIIKTKVNEDLQERLRNGMTVYNEEIKRMIKEFNRKDREVKNV